jgi:hypothetical protein
MKKVLFGLSVVLVAFGFCGSAARAAEMPQAPELSDFLATLGTPAPTLEAKRPIQGKSLCTAMATCANGTTVSCSGNASATSCSGVDHNCPNEKGHVTCDGVTTYCTAPCPCSCSDWLSFCQDKCSGCPYTFKCNASTCPGTCTCKPGCF